MDKKKLGEFAEQAGLGYKRPDGQYWIDAGFIDIHLERFAELVAATEREACAKVCDKAAYWDGHVAANCAAAIRARGDKHD